jgi:ABC-type transport system involved in multi-copper enzyme maturation permease subunit
MMWFTWRQFRTPALVTGALLLVLLAALALTWTRVTELARVTGYTGCQANACGSAADNFLSSVQVGLPGALYDVGIAALFLFPALVGIFWGAPLVARDLETGTYRMIFSQSVSRRRWLLVKLAVGGGAAALGAGLVSLVLSRWAQLIDAAQADRITPLVFPARGIVPIGYAMLAFVVGVTAGLLLRRILTAMVVTLLVVAGLQVAAPFVVRPWLAQPITSVTPLDVHGNLGIGIGVSTGEMRVRVEPDLGNAWILSNDTVTPTGAVFKGPADTTKCGPQAAADRETCPVWLATQHLSQKLTYVPGSTFWALQWREFGVLIALTLGLSWFALWWIRRRLT